MAVFDQDGRLTDRALFRLLDWTAGTRVDIGVSEGHALVARRSPSGEVRLTARGMLLVPAGMRQWCGFGVREQVLLVAVPSLSALVVHGLERLDLALPDPRSLVARMRAVGESPDPHRPDGTPSVVGESVAEPAPPPTHRPPAAVSAPGEPPPDGSPPDGSLRVRSSRRGADRGGARGRR